MAAQGVTDDITHNDALIAEIREKSELAKKSLTNITQATIILSVIQIQFFELLRTSISSFFDCRRLKMCKKSLTSCFRGRLAVRHVLDAQQGRWQLKYHPKNEASARFWNRVIGEYTGGNYELAEAYPNPECDYDDGSKACMIFLNNCSQL